MTSSIYTCRFSKIRKRNKVEMVLTCFASNVSKNVAFQYKITTNSSNIPAKLHEISLGEQ